MISEALLTVCRDSCLHDSNATGLLLFRYQVWHRALMSPNFPNNSLQKILLTEKVIAMIEQTVYKSYIASVVLDLCGEFYS